MWSPRRFLGAGVLTVGVVIGVAMCPIPQASATPTMNTFQVPFVTNCSTFFNPCSFNPVAITGEVPGTVTFPALYPTEPGQPNVKGSYYMHWRNLGTGTAGMLVLPYSEAVSVFTGAGLVTASMTTGFEFIAGTGVFSVP
ncbi:hypothetical protein AB4Z09_05130 [Rhodococcus sp. TAF43]|uniref:hypothetical protein n=1 Tax=unclassified Rhodococcus (in: high G+C Gram-positive bacteria) TaxID=192944 RepID=UPI001583EC5A|nr:hypothetical protein [Rhodococcus sp. W8901]QKT11323.1 hypothetical protein HUN07_11810 [Rhodococcus sp. W8901]